MNIESSASASSVRLQCILVPLRSPSAPTDPALDKAASLAAAVGARLELFHAIDAWGDPYRIDIAQDMRRMLRETAKAALARLEEIAVILRERGIPTRCSVRVDRPPYRAILRQARLRHADLIVLDSHRTHIGARLLGLTDWELLKKSPVPVLLVRDSRGYSKPVMLAAIDPRRASDGSSGTDQPVLRWAEALSVKLDGELHALHAWSPWPSWTLLREPGPGLLKAVQRQIEAEARAAFESALEMHAIPRGRRHLIAQHPIEAIPDAARATGASLVVMGATARSPVGRLLIGSTAEHVLDHLECDVLVVKLPARA